MDIMWLEEYAEKLAHFFEFLLPQAKLSRGITRDLVGERSILFPLASCNGPGFDPSIHRHSGI